MQPTQMLSADTAGLVTFAKADKDNLLYLLKTQLRAERFMKGKLKVTSPVRWELFINGESKMVKDAAEDSISKAATKEITLRLEPEMDYEIAIKLLSTPDDKTAPSLKCELVKDDKFKEVACSTDPDQKTPFRARQYRIRQPRHCCFRITGREISVDPLLGQSFVETFTHLL